MGVVLQYKLIYELGTVAHWEFCQVVLTSNIYLCNVYITRGKQETIN